MIVSFRALGWCGVCFWLRLCGFGLLGLLVRVYSGGFAGRVLRVTLVSVWVNFVFWVAGVLCLGFASSVTLGLVYGFDLVWIYWWVFLYLNVYFLCRFVWPEV